ncbi:hypothetical protein ONZ45_g10127 [Pleurotus djamor]|nr:hypothetical protein ONZ45_g10127 [Pleurotus djamor]
MSTIDYSSSLRKRTLSSTFDDDSFYGDSTKRLRRDMSFGSISSLDVSSASIRSETLRFPRSQSLRRVSSASFISTRSDTPPIYYDAEDRFTMKRFASPALTETTSTSRAATPAPITSNYIYSAFSAKHYFRETRVVVDFAPPTTPTEGRVTSLPMLWSNDNLLFFPRGSRVHYKNMAAADDAAPQLCKFNDKLGDLTAMSCRVDSPNVLALGTSTGTVQLWDISTKTKTLQFSTKGVTSMGWHGAVLSVGSPKGGIRHFDTRISPATKMKEQVKKVTRHQATITQLAWNVDGRLYASGDSSGNVYCWDARGRTPLDTGEFVQRRKKISHEGSITALTWCPWKPKLLVTGDSTDSGKGVIRLWDVKLPPPGSNPLSAHNDPVSNAANPGKIEVDSQVTGLYFSTECQELLSTHGPGPSDASDPSSSAAEPSPHPVRRGNTGNTINVHSLPMLRHITTQTIALEQNGIAGGCINPTGTKMVFSMPGENKLKVYEVWGKRKELKKQPSFASCIIRVRLDSLAVALSVLNELYTLSAIALASRLDALALVTATQLLSPPLNRCILSTLHASSSDIADAPPIPTQEPIAEEEEFYSSWSLFLVCILLIISLWTSYYLQIKKIRAVHETLVSIVAGMVVGMMIRLAPGGMIRDMLTFKHTIFFNLLLPPIILNSGYELKQENFFRNFGSILTFAFAGTFVSAMGIGLLVYIYSFLGLESLDLSLIECLIFGSTLSATDPVTILAIFNQYKVDPKLYSVIFGESLLNDAVSIVMYETLSHFHGTEMDFHLGSVFHGIGLFLVSFSISLAIGVAFGLLTSLLLKHSYLRLYTHLETSLVALAAYTCYFFSNGLSMSNISMSGIVALLFCGITLKHYAYHTMSRRTQRASKYIFQTLAGLSENFIFIYLGMALFTSSPKDEKVSSYFKPMFIIITTISAVFTRYIAVFPLAEAINFVHRHVRGQRSEELPHSYQMMLFWAGLRGAVGVALAAGFKGKNAGMLRTTVLVVVVLTVVMFGGTTARMLEVLGIRTGVEDEAATSSDEEDSARWLSSRRGRWSGYVDDEPSYLAGGRGLSSSLTRGGRGRIGIHYPDRNYYNHHQNNPPTYNQPSPGIPQGVPQGIFSAASSDSDSDDVGEVLPMATGPVPGGVGGDASRGGRSDGFVSGDAKNGNGRPNESNRGAEGLPSQDSREWFQSIDERYLLPLFSNATASRTFHARRARRVSHQRTSSGLNRDMGDGFASGSVTPMISDDEGYDGGRELELGGVGPSSRQIADTRRADRGLNSPTLRTGTPGPLDSRNS